MEILSFHPLIKGKIDISITKKLTILNISNFKSGEMS